MKKLLLTLSIIALVSSCKKENSTTDVNSTELTQEAKDASYAFGLSLGQQAEGMANGPQLKDSLSIPNFEKGLKDYLEDDKKGDSYVLGMSFGQQIKGALENDILKGALSKEEILKGVTDFLNKKDTRISKDSVQSIMQTFYQSQLSKSAEGKKKEGAEFLAKTKKEEGVKATASGLLYKVTKEGEGDSPKLGDTVYVKYTGKTIAGKVFDSTEKNNKGEAVSFPLQDGGLIPGWIEGLQLMKTGGVYTFYIPSNLAYGDSQAGPDIAPGETLIFDIELVKIEKGNQAK